MLHKIQLQATPDVAYDPARLPAAAARELGISPARVKRVDMLRRSIDARRRHVVVNLSLAVHVDEIDPQMALYTPTTFPIFAVSQLTMRFTEPRISFKIRTFSRFISATCAPITFRASTICAPSLM